MCDTPSPPRSLSSQNARGQRKIIDYFSVKNSAQESKLSKAPCQLITEPSAVKRLKGNEEEGAKNQNSSNINPKNVETKESYDVSHSLEKTSTATAVDKLSPVETSSTNATAFDIIGRRARTKPGINNARKVGKYTLRATDRDRNEDETLTTEGDSLDADSDESATDKTSAAVHIDNLFLAEKPNANAKTFDFNDGKLATTKPAKAGINNEKWAGKYKLKADDKNRDVDATQAIAGVSHSLGANTGKSATNKRFAGFLNVKPFTAEKPNTKCAPGKFRTSQEKKRRGNKHQRRAEKVKLELFNTDSDSDPALSKDDHHLQKKGGRVGLGDMSSSWSDDNEGIFSSPAKHTTSSMNLEFYRNKVRSVPDGDFIEDILNNWKDDFKKLEQHHGYIQWLFPLKEVGMNSMAQVLQEHEAKAIREDNVLRERVLRAYKMMLGFYGFVLLDEEVGKVGPSDHFEEQVKHLNSSFHNNLRITRILKSLGELGFEHLKKPLLVVLIREAFLTRSLVNCRRSCVTYWIPTLKSTTEQEGLEKMVKDLENRERRNTPRYGY